MCHHRLGALIKDHVTAGKPVDWNVKQLCPTNTWGFIYASPMRAYHVGGYPSEGCNYYSSFEILFPGALVYRIDMRRFRVEVNENPVLC